MDTTPDSQFDKVVQEVNTLKQGMVTVVKRIEGIEDSVLRVLQSVQRTENSFELRIAETLHHVLSNVVHELGHSIDKTKEQLAQLERGFDIFPVDGKTVHETPGSVLVRKTGEGTYDFAMSSAPDEIKNEGTERFVKWFNENPSVMADRNEITVNIIAYTKAVRPTHPEVA